MNKFLSLEEIKYHEGILWLVNTYSLVIIGKNGEIFEVVGNGGHFFWSERVTVLCWRHEIMQPGVSLLWGQLKIGEIKSS